MTKRIAVLWKQLLFIRKMLQYCFTFTEKEENEWDLYSRTIKESFMIFDFWENSRQIKSFYFLTGLLETNLVCDISFL